MKYITPDYYDEFSCIADQCPDTCCAGWEIAIDKQSIDCYKKVKGPFGNRLHNSIDWNRHTFLQYDHQCIFLNEDKLCDLYTEAGADSLCQTCKQYPRHTEAYPNIRELSLDISCPEVARMLLTRTEKIKFITKETDQREEIDDEFQSKLFEQMNDARRLMIAILQDRTQKLNLRMGLVLGLGHDLQKRISRREYQSMTHLIKHYSKTETQRYLVRKLSSDTYRLNKNRKCRNLAKNRRVFMKQVWKQLHLMRTLNQNWPEEIKHAQQLLDSFPLEQYEARYTLLYQQNPELSIQLEQLLVYFLYVYTNGAVYDGEFYSKVKFAIFHTLAIEELFFTAWIEDGNQLSLKRQIEIAHRYAREMEHDDKNILDLDSSMQNKKEFAFDNIMRCLK